MNALSDLQIETRPCEETGMIWHDYDFDAGPMPAMLPDFDGPIEKESVELLGAPGIPCTWDRIISIHNLATSVHSFQENRIWLFYFLFFFSKLLQGCHGH